MIVACGVAIILALPKELPVIFTSLIKLALVPKLCCTVKPVLYNHVWLYKTGFSVNLELTFIGRWLPYTVTTLNRFHCTLSELADHGVVRVCCPLGGLL